MIVYGFGVLAYGFEPHMDGSINAILGDTTLETQPVSEVERIQEHLLQVAQRLTSSTPTGLTTDQMERRSWLLSELNQYAEKGVFPRRDHHDGQGVRRPRFIDDRGVHCAVGELMRISGHEDLAQMMDRSHEFVYLNELSHPAVSTWATSHGFSRTDLAMIQPSYSKRRTPTVREVLESNTFTTTLKCANHSVPSQISVTFARQADGVVTLESSGSDFATCFAKTMNREYARRDLWWKESEPVRGSLTVHLAQPKASAQALLDGLNLTDLSCHPLPGSLPQIAHLAVSVGSKAPTVEVYTEPPHREVSHCIEERLTPRFSTFQDMKPFNIHATIPLRPRVNEEMLKQTIMSRSTRPGLTCWEPETPNTIEVTMAARAGVADFYLASRGGSAKFHECFNEEFRKDLHMDYASRRRMPDGSFQSYFRIDANASATVVVPLTTPDQRQKRLADEERRKRHGPTF